ncbi:MAG: nuclease [Alteromonadaceae bacterium]|nr:nuclease [Alteromonadaceae bacterium]|tara:strand:+ start:1711 stop:2769 length:1059 start_codon:yes stop_codon:yes gene_type:complete
MAKRKRLAPPTLETLNSPGEESFKTKLTSSRNPLGVGSTPAIRAPIADVAGSAAATAALSEVTAELEAARREGRLVQSLPLEAIEEGHLVRDRLVGAINEDDMQSLMSSLQARGQQSPIEVTEIEPGRYGLISGFRRLTSLRRLHAETGDEKFGKVHALVRRPDTAEAAYVAMVEENEIRVGLSYFERAHIVVRAVEEGVCSSEKQALNSLFGSASRAKRSKIKSFLSVVKALGPNLKFPNAIGERLGLELAARLRDKDFSETLREHLRKANPHNLEAETSLLQEALADTTKSNEAKSPAPISSQRGEGPIVPKGEEISDGLWLTRDDKGVHLMGPGLNDETITRIRTALKK